MVRCRRFLAGVIYGMFFINAISAWKSEISVYWYAKVPNKQNVKDISISVLSVLMIFYFCDA